MTYRRITPWIAAALLYMGGAATVAPAGESEMRRGVDVSKWAGPVPPTRWQTLRNSGWDFAVVGAWGSYGTNPHARAQLQGARSAGLDTAIYVLLHFNRPERRGDWQVRKAVEAIGEDELRHMHFVALDVELKGGPVKSPALIVINDAVRAVEALGLKPVIYTCRRDWTQMTGNTSAFAHLPLWQPRYDGVPRLNVDGAAAWVPFGGWSEQAVKQYKGTTTIQGISADLNVARADLWSRGMASAP